MVKRIRALNKQEFEAATSDGAVYRKYLKYTHTLSWVKKAGIRKALETTKTQGIAYSKTAAFYTTTLEQLKSGDFEYDTQEDVLIVYY
jgi:hypothetical protein